jgi:AraC-like DNA-binding protein
MHSWRTQYDRKVERSLHTTPPGVGHALLSVIVANIFQTLRISATIWEHGADWFPVHAEPSPGAFESEHGREGDRNAYNGRMFAEVQRTKKITRGDHGGFSDLFVPILIRGKVAGIVVTGPFARSRPTSVHILQSWRFLTGRKAHFADPEFAAYLSSVFSTLVLSGEKLRAFQNLLDCLAKLMAGEGRADTLVNRAAALRAELEEARFVDRMWEVTQTMIDERTARTWLTAGRAPRLKRLGFSREVHHVLVGLTASRSSSKDLVDEAVRRNLFQRSAVFLAREEGETLAGQIGDHGVVFLSGSAGAPRTRRDRLHRFAEKAAVLARKDFGLSVHFGLSEVPAAEMLSRAYQDALRAAESALASRVEMAESGDTRQAPSLRNLREQLGRSIEERPDLVGARFDGYLEAVAARASYRMDVARGDLEAGFERIAQPLVSSGALGAKSYGALCEALDRSAGEARSLEDLLAAYRRAAQDLASAVERPVTARQDRSLRSAVDHIHQHYAEPLRLGKVARIAGFAPSHFSKLFVRREHMPFERYVRGLRLERAKQLLFDTDLPSTRIAELSGFGSLQYFSTVFRGQFGMTPLEYRRNNPQVRRSLRNKNKHQNS